MSDVFFCHSVPVLSVPDVICALHHDDISRLLECATSGHLGFVVGFTVSMSSYLSGCLSSFSNSV